MSFRPDPTDSEPDLEALKAPLNLHADDELLQLDRIDRAFRSQQGQPFSPALQALDLATARAHGSAERTVCQLQREIPKATALTTVVAVPVHDGSYNPGNDDGFLEQFQRTLARLAENPEMFARWLKRSMGDADPRALEALRTSMLNGAWAAILPATRTVSFQSPSTHAAYAPELGTIFLSNELTRANARRAWLEEFGHRLNHLLTGSVEQALYDGLGDEGDAFARLFLGVAPPSGWQDRDAEDVHRLILRNPDGSETTVRAEFWSTVDKAVDDTHRRLASYGLAILKDDAANGRLALGDTMNMALGILAKNEPMLRAGALDADLDSTGPYYIGTVLLSATYGLPHVRLQNAFADHFFDINENKGLAVADILGFNKSIDPAWFADRAPDTAESQTRRYMLQAVQSWREGRFDEAAYRLGYASHFLSDAHQPHHASNYPWSPLNSSHTDFEDAVNDDLDRLLASNPDKPIKYTDATEHPYVDQFVTELVIEGALLARSRLDDCIHGYFHGLPAGWRHAARATLAANRDALSKLYYRFLLEVAGPKTTGRATVSPEPNTPSTQIYPIGKVMLITTMGSEGFAPSGKFSHPDAATMTFTFKSGEKVDFTLETDNFWRWYAFNPGCVTAWDFTFPADKSHLMPEDVTAVEFSSHPGQNWSVRSKEIYIHGHRVFSRCETPLIERVPVKGFKTLRLACETLPAVAENHPSGRTV